MQMADVHNKAIRSKNMSAIHSKGTKPELIVRQFLRAHKLGYRKNYKDLPGKPDLVLTKYRVVIFVNGCFWHQHKNCRFASIPKSNSDFWTTKLNTNVERDKINYEKLTAMGWRVLTIWACELTPDRLASLLSDILANH